jgi:hypothetical protein
MQLCGELGELIVTDEALSGAVVLIGDWNLGTQDSGDRRRAGHRPRLHRVAKHGQFSVDRRIGDGSALVRLLGGSKRTIGEKLVRFSTRFPPEERTQIRFEG